MIKIVVLDVMDVVVIVVLIKEIGVEIFVNFVLFYQDFVLMDVCFEVGCYYLDMVNYEFEDVVKFEYYW